MTEIAWLSGMVAGTASNVQQSRYLVRGERERGERKGEEIGKIHEESSARYSQTRDAPLASLAAKNHEPVV